jgi:hypothetical protein
MINSNLNLEKRRTFLLKFTPQRTLSLISTCTLAFLAGETGRCRRVPKNVGQQHLYTPPSGHPRDPPLGHSSRPPLCRASIAPSVKHPCALHQAPVRPLSGPSALRWTPVRVSVCPARPMGITGHPGHSIELLRRASQVAPLDDSV